MWIWPRIIMSLIGAAAAPAAAIGVMAYRMIGGHTVVSSLELALTMLSLAFFGSLVVAVLIGIPMFANLHRRGRLTWWPVTWQSFAIGFVLVHLVFLALYGPAVLIGWTKPLFALSYLSPYLVLAPMAGLAALLVWKTFPLPETAHSATS